MKFVYYYCVLFQFVALLVFLCYDLCKFFYINWGAEIYHLYWQFKIVGYFGKIFILDVSWISKNLFLKNQFSFTNYDDMVLNIMYRWIFLVSPMPCAPRYEAISNFSSKSASQPYWSRVNETLYGFYVSGRSFFVLIFARWV